MRRVLRAVGPVLLVLVVCVAVIAALRATLHGLRDDDLVIGRDTTYVKDPSTKGYRDEARRELVRAIGPVAQWISVERVTQGLPKVGFSDPDFKDATCEAIWSSIDDPKRAAYVARQMLALTKMTDGLQHRVAVDISPNMFDTLNDGASELAMTRAIACELLRSDGDINEKALVLERGWLWTRLLAERAGTEVMSMRFRQHVSESALRRMCVDRRFRAAIDRARVRTVSVELQATPGARAPLVALLEPRQHLQRIRLATLAAVFAMKPAKERAGTLLGVDANSTLRTFNHELDALDQVLDTDASLDALTKALGERQAQADKQRELQRDSIDGLWQRMVSETSDARHKQQLRVDHLLMGGLSFLEGYVRVYATTAQLEAVFEHVVMRLNRSIADAIVEASKQKPKHAWMPPIVVSREGNAVTLMIADQRVELSQGTLEPLVPPREIH